MNHKIKTINIVHSARLKPQRKGKRPPKLLAIVHQSGCTGCEVCIAGCPVDSIEIVSGPDPKNPGFQQLVEIDLERCIGCKNCSEDCPWDTITMYQHDDAFIAWGNETFSSKLYIDDEVSESETQDQAESVTEPETETGT